MATSPPTASRRGLLAYAGPFALFCLLLVLPGSVRPAHPDAAAPLWLAAPEFWVYPLQTILCGGMLLFYRREYPRAASVAGLGFGAVVGLAVFGLWVSRLPLVYLDAVFRVVGLAVFGLWVSPQMFFHFAPRLDGFDPTRLPGGRDNGLYLATVAFRFVRLVVVVPWLEEVFWRGFLLRYLIKEDFLAVPFGAFTLLSFGVVTAGFMFEHSPVDWPAALLAGVLYNGVAIRTRSLPACILAHALTNLLLGVYVMWTRQWGFW